MYPTIDSVKTVRKIKELMAVNNISVKQLQAYLGLSSIQAIYHWFENISIPSIDNIYAMSRLFNVRVDEILQGNDSANEMKRNRLDRMKKYDIMYRQILVEKEFY